MLTWMNISKFNLPTLCNYIQGSCQQIYNQEQNKMHKIIILYWTGDSDNPARVRLGSQQIVKW